MSQKPATGSIWGSWVRRGYGDKGDRAGVSWPFHRCCLGGSSQPDSHTWTARPGHLCHELRCHQVTCWASPVLPAKASQGNPPASFWRSCQLLKVPFCCLCGTWVNGRTLPLKSWATELYFHFQHVYSGASPLILAHQVTGGEMGHQGGGPRLHWSPHWSLLHKWGRGTCPYSMMPRAPGSNGQLRGDSSAVPCSRELEGGPRWQHLILTTGKLPVGKYSNPVSLGDCHTRAGECSAHC